MGHAHGRRWIPGREPRSPRLRAERYGGQAGSSDRRNQHLAPPRDPIPSLARPALLDVHGVPRLRGQRRRVQGDGARRLRPSHHDRSGSQGDPPHAGRRVRDRAGVLRVPDDGDAIVFVEVRGSLRAAASGLRADRRRDGRGPAIRRHRGERAARARGHARGHRPRTAAGNEAAGSLLRRRGCVERRGQCAHPRGIRIRARIRAPRAR